MELEFFCKPDTDLEWFDYWKSFCLNWLSSLGLKEDEVRYRDHDKEELSFYRKATTDVSSSYSHSDGVNCGESLTVQITT